MEALKTIVFWFGGIFVLNIILDAVISSTNNVGAFVVIIFIFSLIYYFANKDK